MQDRRRRGLDGDAIDQAAERAMQELVEKVAPGEHRAELNRLRTTLGELLSTAPVTGPDTVTEIANRARIAAAFRSRVPGEE